MPLSYMQGTTIRIMVAITLVILLCKELVEEGLVRVSPKYTHRAFSNYLLPVSLLVCIGWLGVFDGGAFVYFQF